MEGKGFGVGFTLGANLDGVGAPVKLVERVGFAEWALDAVAFAVKHVVFGIDDGDVDLGGALIGQEYPQLALVECDLGFVADGALLFQNGDAAAVELEGLVDLAVLVVQSEAVGAGGQVLQLVAFGGAGPVVDGFVEEVGPPKVLQVDLYSTGGDVAEEHQEGGGVAVGFDDHLDVGGGGWGRSGGALGKGSGGTE